MLNAGDIDDDYFTAVPSTSLANLFGSPNKQRDTENESLKYTPPKKQISQEITEPQKNKLKTEEESKVTECMFACALSAYEWINDRYSPESKLGFAIIRTTKTNSYAIVLYNSNKTTLSSTTVSTNLNLTLIDNKYISYYDNENKYWSIYGKEEEISKILEILKLFKVAIKQASSFDQNPPGPRKIDIDKYSEVSYDKESDTDSSVNRRTKASILNRMANMGHSVLPPTPLSDKSSDSSDSNEIINQPPKLRSKPVKPTVKRMSVEKQGPILDASENIKMPVTKTEQSLVSVQPSNPALFAMINGQLLPVSNTNVLPAYGGSTTTHEMNLFMSEQRINNNELRINIKKTTDKVEQVLEKLKGFDISSETKDNNFHMETMQKLITEYETKIKLYEQMIISNRIVHEQPLEILHQTLELNSYKSQILNLESAIEAKDQELIKLREHMKEHELVKEITHLKEFLSLKALQLDKVSNELDESRNTNKRNNSQNFENRLKDIMNDVYLSVSTNFDSNDTYSGDIIKKTIASIIKKTTIQLLSDNKSEK